MGAPRTMIPTNSKHSKNARQSNGVSSYTQPMKRGGKGKFNFGSYEDDVFDYYMSTAATRADHNSHAAATAASSESRRNSKVQVVDEDEFLFGSGKA
ncbi:hypothetical protein HDU78_000337 [Chytriomyces hyalinus]|nr:hypothetical protein HDU78_000337 [Chytriomyces hyalinus]